MDDSVIEKIIKHYGAVCPKFKYENRLLDKNVTDLLSKGLIKLLNSQDSSDISNRALVLEIIRKSCKVEPPKHLYIDDNITEILRNIYEQLLRDYNIEKNLDSYLIRNLKELDISPLHTSSFKPDIIQSLVNLSGNKQEIHDILLKDVIHWNVDDNRNSYMDTLMSMWNTEYSENTSTKLSKIRPDDISIKIKPFIENILLPSAFEMLDTVILDEFDWFSEKKDLKMLSKKCSISSECFQICCSILNTLFMKTNFDKQMQTFITLFINFIKFELEYISKLYQSDLQPIVLLLDIELNDLQGDIKTSYIKHALEHLSRLHNECESDLIMLLSHFSQWFDLYYVITKKE